MDQTSMICILFLFLITQCLVSLELQNRCVVLSPVFSLNETMFVTAEVDRRLTIFCDVKESCQESSFKTCAITTRDQSFPLKRIGTKHYIFKTDMVTKNFIDSTIGCFIKSKYGEVFYNSTILVLSRPYHIPILNISKSSYLSKSSLVQCKSQEIVRPRPVVIFYVDEEEVDFVVQPCDNSGGCLELAYIKKFSRSWNKKKIKCCISGPFFKQMCSDTKVLSLKFPPYYVDITRHVLEKSQSRVIVNLMCKVGEAFPPCNVSWCHEGNVISKGQTVTYEGHHGIYTVDNVTLSLPIKPQDIWCKAQCFNFNNTKAKRQHIYMNPVYRENESPITLGYNGYNDKNDLITVMLIVYYSTSANILLVFYLVQNRKNENKIRSEKRQHKFTAVITSAKTTFPN